MGIISASPELYGERNVVCNRCRCKFVVSQEDVVYTVFDNHIITELLPTKFMKDYTERVAEGYRYGVECPICKNSMYIYDHLTNQRIVSGFYDF